MLHHFLGYVQQNQLASLSFRSHLKDWWVFQFHALTPQIWQADWFSWSGSWTLTQANSWNYASIDFWSEKYYRGFLMLGCSRRKCRLRFAEISALKILKLTYHEAFKHCVVSFVPSVLEGTLENIESFLKIALSTELIRLFESSLRCHVITLLIVLSICHSKFQL